MRAWREKKAVEDPDYFKDVKLKSHLSRYGLTIEQFRAMETAQGHVCYICHRPSRPRLFVDHCHETKTVRKLLCRSCNLAVGYVRESPEVARAIVSYLEEQCSPIKLLAELLS